MTKSRPRYTARTMPPYSYVPGHAPHPVSDPNGHLHGSPPEEIEPLEPNRWNESEQFLYAVDLFNHGFYWEAHEAWESLWLAAGRRGAAATLMKALIKLSAAGVKAREGNPRGVQRHSARAGELTKQCAREVDSPYCGVDLEALLSSAQAMADAADSYGSAQPDLLLGTQIRLCAT